MKCWLLFESGRGAEVRLNGYEAAADARRPIDAYMMSDCGADCVEAANRAVEIVYQIACEQGLKPAPMVYGFDLEGNRRGSRVVGPSGGLAFVVAAAARMLGFDPGSVAATGILTAADPNTELQPVRAIQAKLKAAMDLTPENGIILYPIANEPEVDDLLRNRVEVRGIRLHAVRTAAEAVGLLAGDRQKKKGSIFINRSLLAVVAALLLVVGILLYQGMNKEDTGDIPAVIAPTVVKVDTAKTESVAIPQEKPVAVPITETETAIPEQINKGVEEKPIEANKLPQVVDHSQPTVDPENIAEKKDGKEEQPTTSHNQEPTGFD